MLYRGGAFRAGHPVQPVCLKYDRPLVRTRRAPAARAHMPHRYRYKYWNPAYGITTFLPHALRTLTQIYNSLEVHYLPVYVPSEAECKDWMLYASNVRAVMAKTLDVPVTNMSLADKQRLHGRGGLHDGRKPVAAAAAAPQADAPAGVADQPVPAAAAPAAPPSAVKARRRSAAQ